MTDAAGRNPARMRKNHADLTPREKQDRKQRVLTHGESSTTRSIADALVIKSGNLFFLTDQDGQIPAQGDHGLGLYYHDCRYLKRYELRLADTRPDLLYSGAQAGVEAVLQMTNRDITDPDGRVLKRESLGIRWQRTLDAAQGCLHDRIGFHNYASADVAFTLTLTFDAGFEDIFSIRGMLPDPFERTSPEAAWRDGSLSFRRRGEDGLLRRTCIRFDPAPAHVDGGSARFRMSVDARQSRDLHVAISISESPADDSNPEDAACPDTRETPRGPGGPSPAGPDGTRVHSDSAELNRLVAQSLRDVRLLRSRVDGKAYYAAGVPWFATLFGRDSIVVSLQTLMFTHRVAEDTLRILAHYQGKKEDDWREEQPGKILHELRLDEMTRAGELPYSPYYGTVDATALFLILLARHACWVGNLDLFRELEANVRAALNWIDRFGDSDGDGYIDYRGGSSHGLVNQGWKDSGDAVVNADGSLATPPIALVEVQGYTYLAKRSTAELFRRAGEGDAAERLEREASDLQHRFNRDFWLPDLGFYAMARQAGGRPAAVVSSNPGHALWTGIVAPERARRTVQRLMAEDMFSGWGIRTISTREQRYNPVSYHLGSVWPHDNAFAAAGFRRYGFDREAGMVFKAVAQAAADFKHFRLPELFTGFSRKDYDEPVPYPVSCHPQAWGAGAVPFLLQSLLGIEAEGFERRLRITRPMLPDYVDRLSLEGLRVGSGSVDLAFRRFRRRVKVDVTRVDGGTDVCVQ